MQYFDACADARRCERIRISVVVVLRNLMVSFGCTGGQHRSVFLAEQLARHLRSTSEVEVVVRHIELEKNFPDKVTL